METGPRKYPERGVFREVWKAINSLIEQQRRIAPLSGSNVDVNRTVNGSVLSVRIEDPEPGDPGVITQYRVKSVQDDYLTCREFDGTSETGSDVLIAKPYNLRRTGWHGLTVTYTLTPSETWPGAPATLAITYSYVSAVYRTAAVTSGPLTTAEHQVIIPRYVPDKSVIFASGSANGTGVSAADELIDINADGRAWARVV